MVFDLTCEEKKSVEPKTLSKTPRKGREEHGRFSAKQRRDARASSSILIGSNFPTRIISNIRVTS